MNSHSPSTALSSPSTKRKPRFGCFAQSFGLLVGLVLLGSVAFFTWYSVSTKRLNAATKALENAGFTRSFAELQEAYEKPLDGPNPAELWIKAGKDFERYDAVYDMLPYLGRAETVSEPTPGEPWDQYETSKAYLADHAEGFAMLEEAAAATTPPRFTNDVVEALSPNDSWLSGHRGIARAVQLRCTHHAYEGRLSEVIRDIRLGLAIGKSLRDETSSLRSLIGVTCSQAALGQIQLHLNLDFTDEQLQQLQLALREFHPQQSLLKCTEGDVLRGVYSMQDVTQVGPMPRHDDAAFLAEQGLSILVAVESGDWADIAKASADIKEVVEDLKQNPQPNYMMTSLWLPTMQATIDAHLDTAAKLLVHDALIAARRFQLANDRLPVSLGELVPEFLPAVPTDPWSPDGGSLVIKLDDGKLTIYSVGHDRTDDGGDPSEAPSRRERDIVAALAPAK